MPWTVVEHGEGLLFPVTVVVQCLNLSGLFPGPQPKGEFPERSVSRGTAGWNQKSVSNQLFGTQHK